jgi:hypothetical protein
MVDEEESEAGGGCELPQGGNSPASCISSSPVKKVEYDIRLIYPSISFLKRNIA